MKNDKIKISGDGKIKRAIRGQVDIGEVPDSDQRATAGSQAPQQVAVQRRAAHQVRRSFNLLQAGGRVPRQGHEGNFPRSPVRQGRLSFEWIIEKKNGLV